MESELFAILESTADAAYAVTEGGEIRSWNAAAERLFGYSAGQALGRDVDDVLQARDALGTCALAGGADAATRRWDATSGGVANFDLEVGTRAGARIWVSVSTIVFDNRRTGRRLFVRLAHDISRRRRGEELLGRMLAVARQVVSNTDDPSDHAPIDPLSERERRILELLAHGSNPVRIVGELSISPQTLRNHLHRINRKLRTHNRLEAVAHARRRGLIE